MTYEEALEIQEPVQTWLTTQQIDGYNPDPIPQFDLAEQLEAHRIICESLPKKMEDGSIRHWTFPRLIAALYVAGNFEPCFNIRKSDVDCGDVVGFF